MIGYHEQAVKTYYSMRDDRVKATSGVYEAVLRSQAALGEAKFVENVLRTMTEVMTSQHVNTLIIAHGNRGNTALVLKSFEQMFKRYGVIPDRSTQDEVLRALLENDELEMAEALFNRWVTQIPPPLVFRVPCR